MSCELDKSQRRVRNLRREKTYVPLCCMPFAGCYIRNICHVITKRKKVCVYLEHSSIPPETVLSLLLNRLCTLEQPEEDSGSDSFSTLSSDSDTSESSLSDDIRPRNPFPSQPTGKANGARTPRGAPSTGGTVTAGAQPTKKGDAKGTQRQSSGAAAGASGTHRTASKEGKSHTPASIPSTITNVGSATQKPKRIHQTNKQRPGLAKARKVQALEKDEAGNIKFPVTVGIITIWNIGYVVYDREAFHNDRYIWPVGYKMSRLYNSMIDPNNLTTYTCSVIDDGEAPKVQLLLCLGTFLQLSSFQLG